MDKDLIYQILGIVSEIPKGKVASYKQIAILANHPQNARLVGKVLKHSSLYGDYPCHRVVNSVGRLVPGWTNQRVLLENEGVIFKSNGNVDMKKCKWEI
ncbi:MGMT family protein [uncultured Thomasclavelia sp.]|uniref:MGMT family protein n=1 Tax=uncultured Thomasclavelia sp. TaxID=3025759 RepID=UPI0025DC4FC2|nr:MGMT family protein [uncultured Thomasclavelia sp.]